MFMPVSMATHMGMGTGTGTGTGMGTEWETRGA